MNGWTGKLLRVNLTTGQSAVESSEKYFDYIGGKGMANRIIYEEVPNGTEPTAPESKIVMAKHRHQRAVQRAHHVGVPVAIYQVQRHCGCPCGRRHGRDAQGLRL